MLVPVVYETQTSTHPLVESHSQKSQRIEEEMKQTKL